MRKISLLLFLSTVCIASSQEEVKLDKIKIIAKKDLSSKPTFPSWKVSKKSLEAEHTINVEEALQDITGIIVKDAGGIGTALSVFIRGGNVNHAKVVVDGIEATDPTTPIGESQLQHFLVSGIDEIDVQKGPQENGASGSIHLKTHKGTGPLKASAEMNGGSFGMYQPQLGIKGQLGKANLNIAFSQLGMKGTVAKPKRLRMTARDHQPDPYMNRSFASRLGYDLTERAHFSLFTRDIYSEKDFIGPQTSSQRTLTHQAFHRIQGDFWGYQRRWHHELAVSWVGIETRTEEEECLSFKSTGRRLQGQWKQEFIVSPKYLVQAEVFLDEEEGKFLTQEGGQKARAVTTALSLKQTWKPVENIEVSLKGRQDWLKKNTPFTWRLEGGWIYPVTKTKFFGSVSTGFKNPSLTQKFINFGTFKGNPLLKPERSKGWEVGVSQWLGHKKEITLTYFENNLRNLIAAKDDFTTSINIAHASLKGLESSLQWAFGPTVLSTLAYTYLRAFNRISRQQLLRRPAHTFSFKTLYSPTPDLLLGVKVLKSSSQKDIDSQSLKKVTQAGYMVVNLWANYKIDKTWTSFLKITNAFNKQYEEINGFMAPGFGVFFGLKTSFS